MLKKITAVLPLLACFAFANTAQAEELAYTFLEVNYTPSADFEVEQQNIDRSADGYGIAFAWLMGSIAYSEWRYNNYDLGDRDDGQTASARFGVHHRLNTNGYGKLDLFGGVGAEYANFERKGANAPAYIDDTGLLGYIGLRYAWNQHLEYGVELGIHNIEKNGNLAEAHVQWNATHAVSFRASYYDANYQIIGPDVDLTGFKIAARVTFGQGG